MAAMITSATNSFANGVSFIFPDGIPILGPQECASPLSKVRLERFERPTHGFEVRCSIQLSYKRVTVCVTERARDTVVAAGRARKNSPPSGRFS